MKYLNIETKQLQKNGAFHTAKEISGQPTLWKDIYEKVLYEKNSIAEFLKSIMPDVDNIILTGAGTSAFIGHSLEGVVMRSTKKTVLSIPTTHLVSHPQDYFNEMNSTLLISFARSGNSPESVASVALAEKYFDKCFQLIITCNPDGKLANYSFKNKSYIFVLPEDADDKSLAMTGSYSGMLLAALLINDIVNIEKNKSVIDVISDYGTHIINEFSDKLKKIASLPFKRAVFLGSGPLYGTALESQLKLQELTDGKVICKHDSYLGFRHGPKAVVDESTLVVYFFSNKESVARYEKDLVSGMSKGKRALFQMGISETKLDNIPLNIKFNFVTPRIVVDESFLSVCFILFGQMLGFYKSLDLNLQPDTPSKSGAISRVVEGVVIYED